MNSQKSKLLIVTTVPTTLASILSGQPRWLSKHFDVALATSPEPLAVKVGLDEGLTIHTVSMHRGISPLNDLKSIVNMIRVIRRVKPDIIHSYTPKAGLVGMLAGAFARVPVRIHTFTGLIFPTASGVKKKILIAVDRLICRAATHIVPEGMGVKNDLLNAKITSKKLEIIGNGNIAGVDVAHFDPLAEGVPESVLKLNADWKIPSDAFVFGFAGRLNRDKGLDELSAAFSTCANQKTWLVCAGDLDETAPPKSETMELLRSHPRVVLTGHVADVRPVLARADTLVLPSYREGFPNVLLQAAAMGTPLIGTDISGSNEIIDEGQNGFIVPSHDADALGQAMDKVMKFSDHQRAEIGRAGRAKVIEKYEQSVLRNSLLVFYQKALGIEN